MTCRLTVDMVSWILDWKDTGLGTMEGDGLHQGLVEAAGFSRYFLSKLRVSLKCGATEKIPFRTPKRLTALF